MISEQFFRPYINPGFHVIVTAADEQEQWRRKLVELRGAGNKMIVEGGHLNVYVYIAL